MGGSMIRALWLASWYPSDFSAQNGDFIQRHAQAVSAFASVHVMHVVGYGDMQHSLKVTTNKQHRLIEEIIYYKKKKSNPGSRLVSVYKYFSLYKRFIRKYIRTHGKPNVVHVHVSMRAGILALWMKRKYNIPYVVTEHWTVYTDEDPENFYKKNFVFRYFAKKVFKYASAVLPVSNNLGKNIRRMVVNVPFIKVANVVSNNFFYEKIPDSNRPFTFLHVSSLLEIKNPKGILHAYKKLLQKEKSVLLKMVGKNRDDLIIYAEALSIPKDKIIFTGEISNHDVAEEMQNADAFILFSKSENAPCVITESLCCGVPVIAANVGGVSELIDESNGILIPANDEQALSDAMKNMIHNYANYKRGAIAKQASALYNYATIGRQIVDIYEQVLHK